MLFKPVFLTIALAAYGLAAPAAEAAVKNTLVKRIESVKVSSRHYSPAANLNHKTKPYRSCDILRTERWDWLLR